MKPSTIGLLLLILNVALIAIGVVLLVDGIESSAAKAIWIFNVILNSVMAIPNAKLAFAG